MKLRPSLAVNSKRDSITSPRFSAPIFPHKAMKRLPTLVHDCAPCASHSASNHGMVGYLRGAGRQRVGRRRGRLRAYQIMDG